MLDEWRSLNPTLDWIYSLTKKRSKQERIKDKCLNPTLDWIYSLTLLLFLPSWSARSGLNPTLDWIYSLTRQFKPDRDHNNWS